jgi:hypothetical protein
MRVEGLDVDDLNFESRPYNGVAAYGQSKLANILFTRELAKRLVPRVMNTYNFTFKGEIVILHST